jgi:MFS family permease
VFQTYYSEVLLPDESESSIGWIGAVNVFILFAGSLVTGRILDLFGPAVSQPQLKKQILTTDK